MKKESMNVEKGFTLMELMIVVVVIGVLSIIAIPIYADYATRTQVFEAVAITAPIRKAHEEFFMEHGKWAIGHSSPGYVGLASSYSCFRCLKGKYIWYAYLCIANRMGGTGGVIIVYFGEDASKSIYDKEMAFVAKNNGGSISWICNPYTRSGKAIDMKYLPKECS